MAEIQEWSAVPNAFITTILSEGKVLYEKSADRFYLTNIRPSADHISRGTA